MRSGSLTLAAVALALGPWSVVGAVDCNGNGVEDAEDISSRTSDDCNRNGRPDECDVEPRRPGLVSSETYRVLGSTMDLTAADLDRDGFEDLVAVTVSSVSRDRVAVFINRQDGTFEAPDLYPLDGGPVSVTAADLNGDGHVDLVTANRGSGDLALLFNGGPGWFASPRRLPLGDERRPRFVGHGDIDGDGDTDLLVLSSGIDRLSVLRNRGRGTFDRLPEVDVGRDPRHLALADFDGDGRIDVAVANFLDETITVLFGEGGRLTLPAAPRPQHVELADIDGDGDPDIILASGQRQEPRADGGVSVLRNLGARRFAESTVHGPARDVLRVVAVDWDGDGDLDVVAGANDRSGRLALSPFALLVYSNPGSGPFGADTEDVRVVRSERRPESVVAADLDGDGGMEVVTTEAESDRDITVFRRQLVSDADLDRNGFPDDCQRLPFFPLDFRGPDVFSSGHVGLARAAVRSRLHTIGVEPGSDGVQGWSLAVIARGCFPTSATVERTAAARVTDDPPGLRETGYELTKLLGPDDARWLRGPPADGAVFSAVVLSFTLPVTLPPEGSPHTVLRVEVAPLAPDGTECRECRLVHETRTFGESHFGLLTFQGATFFASSVEGGKTVLFCPALFRRGDATADGEIDISDGVLVFDYLFLGGAAPLCREAADSNDDGAIDIADGIHILSFLFLGGDAPPAPTPGGVCGTDPGDPSEFLGCESYDACPS